MLAHLQKLHSTTIDARLAHVPPVHPQPSIRHRPCAAVDSIPSIMLGLDTPYVEARWRTATESPIKVADGDDKSGMNATVLVCEGGATTV